MTTPGTPHHVELWVSDLQAARASFGWLHDALGYRESATWSSGCTWAKGATAVVLEAGPDVRDEGHDRRRPGMNHLAFHAGTQSDVDVLAVAARQHGWSLLFADRHPYAGGAHHYAAYLEDAAGFEVELVASVGAVPSGPVASAPVRTAPVPSGPEPVPAAD